MRYIGIDFGSKKIGIALSDEAGTMGFPHSIIANTPSALSDVLALIEKERVEGIVMGKSIDLSGEPNPIAGAAQTFAEELAARTGLPAAYESEVFTSEEARQAPHKMEKTRAPARHEPVDASAAALILTSYLSRSHA